ncbi:MAG: hypothetical protein ACI4UK_05115 [Floccifex sp.]
METQQQRISDCRRKKGDIVKQAGLLNTWESMAREIIYDCMICV